MPISRLRLSAACFLLVTLAAKDSCQAGQACSSTDDTVSLLQVHSHASQRKKDVYDEECSAACHPNCPMHCYQPGMAVSQKSTEPNKCTPQCTWKCTEPKCDEHCYPECEAPKCETRCSGMNTKRCRMVCGKPDCAVTCPKDKCPTKTCAVCKAHCSDPVCNLQCKAGGQPCRNVCETPSCKWKCEAPKPEDCKKPVCSMSCEMPKNCMGKTYKQLPPLKPGETAITSVDAELPGVSLIQTDQAANLTRKVQMRVMGEDGILETKMVEMPVVNFDAL